ncbi:uncharacterized protein LOC113385649 [Ctenocephalides felis]|uniref:uncharacterized protein LOC113385649 n=1 Tax=Ctenocephalides felis TaxID=7515 RepID=UPI000E6E3909|nr:uncharacterized protein LOC113385649 [Ctenocephalides felis]
MDAKDSKWLQKLDGGPFITLIWEYRDRWQGSSSNPAVRRTAPSDMQVTPTPTTEISRSDPPKDDKDREQRLGFTGFGTTGGYPGSAAGIYTPLKLDLGGLLVGTLVSIGAIFILPKIVNIVSGGYGYARSEDGTGVTQMLARLDDTLSKFNIDSSSCMQRAVCSYVKTSEGKISEGAADQFDQLVHALSGTAIKEAIIAGRKQLKEKTCEELYPGCKLDKQKGIQMISKLLHELMLWEKCIKNLERSTQ